jgi:exoribonuclease R
MGESNSDSVVPVKRPARRSALCTLALAALLGMGLQPVAARAETVVERAARTGVITLGGRTDAAPYSFLDDKQEVVGLSIDVANRIAAEVGAYLGRPVKILEKHRAQAIGQFRSAPMGGGRVLPVDKKSLGREIMVPPGQEGEAEDGDLVAVALHRKNKLGLVEGRVTERMGSIKSEKAVSLIAIHTHGIPNLFPATALAESEQAKPATLAGPGRREDWRHVPLVTIDPADAKDHDDAVHATPDPDPKNIGGHIKRLIGDYNIIAFTTRLF